MKNSILLIVSALFLLPHPIRAQETDKTVLLAILARNKAHVLPHYLSCIDNLDYNKNLITIYINTNNNSDETKEILLEWITKNENNYRNIIFESHEIQELPENLPHDWTVQRLKALSIIRNKSLQMAKNFLCDYYFVVDCDNFITPITLKYLINQNKPIIAPMLTAMPEKNDPYSNFFYEIDEWGYYRNHTHYWTILSKEITGTVKVPVVHCTYLIELSCIDKVTYVDGSDDYDFVIFSRSARNNNVDQYICNDGDFGVLFHSMSCLTLQEEKAKIDDYFGSITNN